MFVNFYFLHQLFMVLEKIVIQFTHFLKDQSRELLEFVVDARKNLALNIRVEICIQIY